MRPRVFGLMDAMILVAAVAVEVWVIRSSWLDLVFPGPRIRGTIRAYFAIQFALAVAIPHIAACTLALLAIRLRRPRPPLRRLARQPGSVACLIASSCVVALGCWVALNMAAGRIAIRVDEIIVPGDSFSSGYRLTGLQGPLWIKSFISYADRVGFAVAGGWLCLLLGRGWHPEPGWIDRIGRALGWFWMGVAIVIWLSSFLV